ncbi:MAG: SCO family protein [Vicinamibacterales bacterium]
MRRLPSYLCRSLLALTLTACARPPAYDLRGQIVVVDPARQELTIKHGDIKGFMPGMTMAFKVREAAMMSGKSVGDLVSATLVIEENQGYLTRVEVTGHEPLTEPPPALPGAAMLEPGASLREVRLVDQDGTARQLSGWQGQALALTFIYTRCPMPDFCPLLDRHFAAVQQEVASSPDLDGRVHLVSVTMDPGYDTPPVLLEHARRVGARPDRWTFATGEPADLTRLGAQLGLSILPPEASSSAIIHNLRTAVIDPSGRLTTILSGNDWRPADLVKELRRAISGQ